MLFRSMGGACVRRGDASGGAGGTGRMGTAFSTTCQRERSSCMEVGWGRDSGIVGELRCGGLPLGESAARYVSTNGDARGGSSGVACRGSDVGGGGGYSWGGSYWRRTCAMLAIPRIWRALRGCVGTPYLGDAGGGPPCSARKTDCSRSYRRWSHVD